MIRKSKPVFDNLMKVMNITLHEKQEEIANAFFVDGHRFIVVVAGRRSGKTKFAALLALYACLEKDAKIWIVSKTYDLASKVFNYLVPMLEELTGNKGLSVQTSTLKLSLPWGTTVECKSADHPQSLLGEGVDFLIVDEAAEVPEEVWLMRLSPTLRDRKGSVLFITTPLGRNWIYDLYIKGQKGEDGFWSTKFSSWVNTFVYDNEEKELAKRQLDEVTYRGQHEAEFVSYNNIVYDCFTREDNIVPVDTRDKLAGWSVSLSVDPGYNGACAMLWIAHNKVTQEDIVIREVIQPKLEYNDVLDIIKQYEPPNGYEAFICDIAGNAHTQETGKSFVDWMLENPYFYDNHRYWEFNVSHLFDDLQLVRSRFRNAAQEHKLFVTEDLYDLIYALENYAYPKDTSSEVPVKDGRTDHPCDALRYYIIWRYRETYVRSVKRR